MNRRDQTNSVFQYIDWTTVLIYLFMVVLGIFSIYAASYSFDNASMFDSDQFSGKQIRWFAMAIILAVVILLFDFRVFEAYAYPIYLLLLVIMFITIFVAPNINGSYSWLVMGPIRFQPAEFGKAATALALAKLFSTYGFSLNSTRNFAIAVSLILVPVAIIVMQKETGSALSYFALFFVLYREGMNGLILFAALCAVVYFVVAIKYAGIPFMGMELGDAIVMMLIMLVMVGMLAVYCKQIIQARNLFFGYLGSFIFVLVLDALGVHIPGMVYFITAIIGGCAYCFWLSRFGRPHKFYLTVGAAIVSVMFLFTVHVAFTKVLQPHQQQRILVTLGKQKDLLGDGYNVNQAQIAIGSGGFFGKGYLNGTQTKLKYVPEQHTDFIFCTIGEEKGFVGATGVVLLFLILILRILHIAERQPTIFGRVYAYCVASYFIFHLAVNVGMVIGLCPVIGIPLPFFSYGGSSLWSFTILLFVLLRLDASRREYLSY